MEKVINGILCCGICPGSTEKEQFDQSTPTTNVSTSEHKHFEPKKLDDDEVDVDYSLDKITAVGNVESEPKTPKSSIDLTPITPEKQHYDSHEVTKNSEPEEPQTRPAEKNTFATSDYVTQVSPTSANDKVSVHSQFSFEQLDLVKMQPDQSVASTGWLLEAKPKKFGNKKCLVLDLDETLVHSSFKYLRSADFVIPVEIEGQVHNVYVIKRPGVDEFMKRVGELYEVVVFTASVSRYGDPLLNELDIHNSIHHRLFRDSCYNYQGNYIKNLSQIGRPLRDLIIIDNSPASYIFHPSHAVPISSWFSDAHDNELLDLLPFLEDLASDSVDDVSLVLDISTV